MRKATKTEQAYCLLKQRIQDGIYAAGEALPKEVELAAELGIVRKTLRVALARLALENRIERIKGKGTFVRNCDSGQMKILVVLDNVDDMTYPGAYILPGILREAEEMHLGMETCSCISLLASPLKTTLSRIRQNGFCGILCFSSNFKGDEPLFEVLKGTDLPVLLPHAHQNDSSVTGFAVMGTDYSKVIRDGLHYLARLGHRRVAFLTYADLRIDKESYFQYVREEGLDEDPALRVEAKSYNQREAIVEAAERLIKGAGKPPTAILCFSDFFALYVCEYLQTEGYSIPDDISLLSIGGLIGCDFLNPPLSALDFDCLGIGRAAVRNLVKMIKENKSPLPFIVTPHHLTERKSTKNLLQYSDKKAEQHKNKRKREQA